jgi:hypothetical protein
VEQGYLYCLAAIVIHRMRLRPNRMTHGSRPSCRNHFPAMSLRGGPGRSWRVRTGGTCSGTLQLTGESAGLNWSLRPRGGNPTRQNQFDGTRAPGDRRVYVDPAAPPAPRAEQSLHQPVTRIIRAIRSRTGSPVTENDFHCFGVGCLPRARRVCAYALGTKKRAGPVVSSPN